MRHSLEFVGKGSIHFSPGKVHPHTRPQFRGSLATPPPPGVRLRLSGESRPPLRNPAYIFPSLKGFSPLLLGASLAAKCPGVKKPPVLAHRSGVPWCCGPKTAPGHGWTAGSPGTPPRARGSPARPRSAPALNAAAGAAGPSGRPGRGLPSERSLPARRRRGERREGSFRCFNQFLLVQPSTIYLTE